MVFALLGVRGLELLGLLFWVWIIFECARRERGTRRLAWLLVVVLLPDVGSLIYFLVRIARING